MLGTININFKQLEIMKEQLKELQDLIIEMIKKQEYKLSDTGIFDNHFDIKIEIDDVLFHFSIPMNKAYLAQHGNPIRFDSFATEIATILFDRHFELIKKQEIQKQIAELQKQLK